jgi:hypothetical protein
MEDLRAKGLQLKIWPVIILWGASWGGNQNSDSHPFTLEYFGSPMNVGTSNRNAWVSGGAPPQKKTYFLLLMVSQAHRSCDSVALLPQINNKLLIACIAIWRPQQSWVKGNYIIPITATPLRTTPLRRDLLEICAEIISQPIYVAISGLLRLYYLNQTNLCWIANRLLLDAIFLTKSLTHEMRQATNLINWLLKKTTSSLNPGGPEWWPFRLLLRKSLIDCY